MVCAAVSWVSAGPIVTLKGIITGENYKDILARQIHPMMQALFPAGEGIFQYDNPLAKQQCLINHGLKNTSMKLDFYLGPHGHPTSI
ncbi:hypothetical protein TNCV_2359461 [Trichonephila clavipes]|nr:hypothetical protein TNCV_2359461 [Trichonephila clavipes]